MNICVQCRIFYEPEFTTFFFAPKLILQIKRCLTVQQLQTQYENHCFPWKNKNQVHPFGRSKLAWKWTEMAGNRCRYSKCRNHCKNWRLNVVIVNVQGCSSYCKSEPDTFLRNKKCLFSKASLTFLSDAVAVFILHKNHCKTGIIRKTTFHFRGHRINSNLEMVFMAWQFLRCEIILLLFATC